MKSIKKNWLLPSAVFAIAIAGAFASNLTTEDSLDTVGYIDAPAPCQLSVECSLIKGPVCRSSTGQQAFGWNNMHTACDVEVYKL